MKPKAIMQPHSVLIKRLRASFLKNFVSSLLPVTSNLTAPESTLYTKYNKTTLNIVQRTSEGPSQCIYERSAVARPHLLIKIPEADAGALAIEMAHDSVAWQRRHEGVQKFIGPLDTLMQTLADKIDDQQSFLADSMSALRLVDSFHFEIPRFYIER